MPRTMLNLLVHKGVCRRATSPHRAAAKLLRPHKMAPRNSGCHRLGDSTGRHGQVLPQLLHLGDPVLIQITNSEFYSEVPVTSMLKQPFLNQFKQIFKYCPEVYSLLVMAAEVFMAGKKGQMSGHRQVDRDHRGWEYLIFGSRNSSYGPAGLGQHQPVGFKQMGTGPLHKHPASIHHNPDVCSVASTQEMLNELQARGRQKLVARHHYQNKAASSLYSSLVLLFSSHSDEEFHLQHSHKTGSTPKHLLLIREVAHQSVRVTRGKKGELSSSSDTDLQGIQCLDRRVAADTHHPLLSPMDKPSQWQHPLRGSIGEIAAAATPGETKLQTAQEEFTPGTPGKPPSQGLANRVQSGSNTLQGSTLAPYTQPEQHLHEAWRRHRAKQLQPTHMTSQG
ncbi:hypothetical protein Anapl_14804 [Anas platyrhynchos]|uniref:Uncharacterized protein n=1 Tax=Anas platyrhynchos TaxID=8839 RepID=R0JHV9_ANAPL|nr:hypothetical protein Anapl_14804 [Anas platyrhynchos]